MKRGITSFISGFSFPKFNNLHKIPRNRQRPYLHKNWGPQIGHYLPHSKSRPRKRLGEWENRSLYQSFSNNFLRNLGKLVKYPNNQGVQKKSESSKKIESRPPTFKIYLKAPKRIKKTSHGLQKYEKDEVERKRWRPKKIESKEKVEFIKNGFRENRFRENEFRNSGLREKMELEENFENFRVWVSYARKYHNTYKTGLSFIRSYPRIRQLP